MKGLEKTVVEIDKMLAEKEKVQDELIAESREIVRECARAIKAIHLNDFAEAKRIVKELDGRIARVSKKHVDFEHITSTAMQEYVEIKVLMAILEKKEIPSFQELGVDYRAFLSGLADCVGELRRSLLIALRNKKRKEAEYVFGQMEGIYDNLMTLKYSSSLVGALKPKQDMIRSQVERARSELLEL